MTVSDEAIQGALGRASFLEHLSPSVLKALARNAHRRIFAPGAPIVHEGQHGHCLYVLVQGGVNLQGTTSDGRIIDVDSLHEPGGFFGEMAVLGFTLRRETAIADKGAVVVEIGKALLERLDKENRGGGGPSIKGKLEELARERAAYLFFTRHAHLGQLDARTRRHLAAHSRLVLFARGQDVLKTGEPARSVLVIKSGLTRLWRMKDRQKSVYGYLNPGDVLLPPSNGASSVWPCTLTAMLHLEVLQIDAAVYQGLNKVEREHFAQATRDFQLRADAQRSLQSAEGPENTVMGAVKDFEQAGALEARSLLTINLNTCIRCGNCVQSCEARHGHAKFIRKGKVATRREDIEVAGRYERILFPTSCQHCASPDCMVDCPTGAIHRKATGEVSINAETCIGCGNCARGCSWGNITMVPSPERIVDPRVLLTNRISEAGVVGGAYSDVDFRRIASKCDLCEGYSTFNCVNNCPTGAILRVEPAAYYEELKQFVPREGEGVGRGGTLHKKQSQLGFILGMCLLMFALGGIFALAWEAGFRPETAAGRSLGLVAAGSMGAATLLAVRRRMNRLGRKRRKTATPPGPWRRFLDHQLGSFRLWTRLHMGLGIVGVTAAFLHAGGRPGAPLTAVLFALTALEAFTGIFGAWLHRWLPRRISRLEGEALLEEDLVSERVDRRSRRRDLLAQARVELRKADSALPRSGFWRRLLGGYDGRAVRKTSEARVSDALLPPEERATLKALAEDRIRLAEIAVCLLCYRVRRAWLLTHIAVTVALLAFVAAHLWAVRWLWGSLI